MKSFQEIFNQTLAEAQAGRIPRSRAPKGSPFQQSPYILDGNFKPFPDQRLKKTSSSNAEKTKTPKADPRRPELTEAQKKALKFFHSYGEMLDDQAGTADIKKAFRRLAKKLHPDSAFTVDPEKLKKRADEFHQLHLAYRELIH